ncbi:unnamed protein product [Mycena citricolor]|uniref:NADP-dependent oxidoreductase domain-containing protein n=1 Tax=Mycena citricolor TaxID=2018698 RepID=A0AAD2K775_9AGAR|nr:unnamed protein product [Mycena citricolor]
MTFETIPLNDGKEIPAIAFGTGSVYKFTDVTRLVAQALESGFWHVDTAQYYGTEEFVGDVIRESGLARSELYITTKYSWLGNVADALPQSLQNLGLKFVDLYLIHSPRPGYEEVWKTVESFQKQGFTKSIGVSNFHLEQLQNLLQTATVWPAVNQIELHPYTYADYKDTIDWAQEHGIVIEAFSSLSPITKYPGGPVDVPVAAAAARLGITPTQVLLSWVRAKGAVIVTTTSKKERLREYLAVGDLPPLSDEDVAAIDAAGAKGPPSSMRLRLKRMSRSRHFRVLVAVLQVALFVWMSLYVVHRFFL